MLFRQAWPGGGGVQREKTHHAFARLNVLDRTTGPKDPAKDARSDHHACSSPRALRAEATSPSVIAKKSQAAFDFRNR